MNVGQFYAEIRASLARGTTLDAEIPIKAKTACRWLERNNSYKYMERFGRVTIAESDCPAIINLPSPFVKTVRWVAQRTDGESCGTPGGLRYLKKRTALEQRLPAVQSFPTVWWQNGLQNIQLNVDPTAGDVFEMGWFQYTDWPIGQNAEAAKPIILLHAWDLMVAQTLILFAQRLRDNRMYAMYKDQREEAIKTMDIADGEIEEIGADNVMQFGRTEYD